MGEKPRSRPDIDDIADERFSTHRESLQLAQASRSIDTSDPDDALSRIATHVRTEGEIVEDSLDELLSAIEAHRSERQAPSPITSIPALPKVREVTLAYYCKSGGHVPFADFLRNLGRKVGKDALTTVMATLRGVVYSIETGDRNVLRERRRAVPHRGDGIYQLDKSIGHGKNNVAHIFFSLEEDPRGDLALFVFEATLDPRRVDAALGKAKADLHQLHHDVAQNGTDLGSVMVIPDGTQPAAGLSL